MTRGRGWRSRLRRHTLFRRTFASTANALTGSRRGAAALAARAHLCLAAGDGRAHRLVRREVGRPKRRSCQRRRGRQLQPARTDHRHTSSADTNAIWSYRDRVSSSGGRECAPAEDGASLVGMPLQVDDRVLHQLAGDRAHKLRSRQETVGVRDLAVGEGREEGSRTCGWASAIASARVGGLAAAAGSGSGSGSGSAPRLGPGSSRSHGRRRSRLGDRASGRGA